MIYTVTFNPAIDYVMQLNNFEAGKTNRSERETLCFGGKGINVSSVLAQLGAQTTALGFIAGFTGDALAQAMQNEGIHTDFVVLESGYTRINIKLKGEQETEINAQGPAIPENKLEELYQKLDGLTAGDTLVLAGSVPNSLPQDVYEKILARLQGKGIRFVVDATKELLQNVLKYKPFLIKPNQQELEELFGRAFNTEEEIADAARELKKQGAVNVLVSRGKDGALLIDEFGVLHRQPARGGKPVNTVGAGDSMVAGFLVGADKNYAYALRLGSAAGGATACSQGLARKEDIIALMEA